MPAEFSKDATHGTGHELELGAAELVAPIVTDELNQHLETLYRHDADDRDTANACRAIIQLSPSSFEADLARDVLCVIEAETAANLPRKPTKEVTS